MTGRPTPTTQGDVTLILAWWRLARAEFLARPSAKSAALIEQMTRILHAVAAARDDSDETGR
jgi:hypothetical protein